MVTNLIIVQFPSHKTHPDEARSKLKKLINVASLECMQMTFSHALLYRDHNLKCHLQTF